ncbi:MAG: universal stress protein [Gammaproteobacteria bacterium]
MKNILVAIDDIETTTIASALMQRTLELAHAFSSQVWLVHIVARTRESGPFNVDGKVLRHEGAAELSKEHEFLQSLARCLRERGVEAKALLIEGATVKTLLKESERLAVDLIVLGCHRHRVPYGVLTEFTEEGLLANCKRPVMYIPMP